MLDKTRRLEELTPAVGVMLGLDKADRATAARAATLAKADLASNMVVEMTSLQGLMGGHYALRDGEPEAVAAAIAEQYEAVSTTPAALAVALADRLDSLAGLFAAGLGPKGSNDPFGLRRSALQLIENLTANEQHFDLRTGAQCRRGAAAGGVERRLAGRGDGFHQRPSRSGAARTGLPDRPSSRPSSPNRPTTRMAPRWPPPP